MINFLLWLIIAIITTLGRRQRPNLFTFGYNQRTGQYIGLDGVVDETLVLDAMEQRINLGIERLRNYLAAVQAGAGDLADLEVAAITEIRNMNVQLFALGNGGFDSMSPVLYTQASKIVQDELGYFRDFAAQIQAGELSTAQIEDRLQKYGKHAWAAYWVGQGEAKSRAGFTQERRIAVDDGGTCPDCKDYEAQGWQPLNSLPKPGYRSQCQANCRCTMEYR